MVALNRSGVSAERRTLSTCFQMAALFHVGSHHFDLHADAARYDPSKTRTHARHRQLSGRRRSPVRRFNRRRWRAFRRGKTGAADPARLKTLKTSLAARLGRQILSRVLTRMDEAFSLDRGASSRHSLCVPGDQQTVFVGLH